MLLFLIPVSRTRPSVSITCPAGARDTGISTSTGGGSRRSGSNCGKPVSYVKMDPQNPLIPFCRNSLWIRPPGRNPPPFQLILRLHLLKDATRTPAALFHHRLDYCSTGSWSHSYHLHPHFHPIDCVRSHRRSPLRRNSPLCRNLDYRLSCY